MRRYPIIIFSLLAGTNSIAAEPPGGQISTSTEPAAEQINTVAEPVDAPVKETIPPAITREQTLQMIESATTDNIKINHKGEVIGADAPRWDCLHQKKTGLTWEVKTNNGLRDKSNTYTWVNAKPNENGLMSWFNNPQGKCTGNARCESGDYTATINREKLCNFDDWRLPTRKELETILDMSKGGKGIKIDNTLFPNTLASWYWTSDENTTNSSYAWYVMFNQGISLSDKKDNPKHVRLVRGTR